VKRKRYPQQKEICPFESGKDILEGGLREQDECQDRGAKNEFECKD
jgi:hypothetical protein